MRLFPALRRSPGDKSAKTPFTDEPGTSGQQVVFSRMMGKSMKPVPWPVPTCSGVSACSQ